MSRLGTFRTASWPPAALVLLLTGAVYLLTLTPGVGFIDSGELAAVCCRLGVAHPTGYPLFTLVGALAARLPIGPEEIVRLNRMAALSCSLAAVLFFLTLRSLLLFGPIHGAVHLGHRQRLFCVTASAVGGALLLAFSRTFWTQALGVEVYSLHLLLLSAVIYLFVRAAYVEQDDEGRATSWWLLCSFVLGLAFTNHMTTILLLPGLLIWFVVLQRWGVRARKIFAAGVVSGLAGLSLYLYLPLRAAGDPVPGWGHVTTLERLLWHVSGKQYRVWIFSSSDAALRQLSAFLNGLPAEVAYTGLPLALLGLLVLWRSDRTLFWATIILWVSCVLYAINYEIHDIASYFLLAYWCVALWGTIGLYRVLEWLAGRLTWSGPLIASVACIPALVALLVQFPRVDQSENHTVEDYTRAMFASFDSNAVVLSYQWDYWVSASYYYQLVRNLRTDVTVIDKELLRRSWYIREVRNRFPSLLAASRAEIDAFLVELQKFEQERPYQSAVIQARFEGMINAIVRNALSTHPVYVTGEIEPEFTVQLQRVPWGLAYRLFRDSTFHDSPSPEFKFRPIPESAEMGPIVRRFYANAALAWGEYRFRSGKEEPGLKHAVELALLYDPAHPAAQKLARRPLIR